MALLQTGQGVASRVYQKSLGSPALGAVTDVHAPVVDDGNEQTITTGLTDPDVPRNVTASSDGTQGDIKAIQVTVHGTNEFDEVISEVMPVFTVNLETTVVGAKVFKTVTSVVIPAHDGNGATTEFGLGAKLGAGVLLDKNTVISAFFGGVLESTAPTVTFSATAVESNGMTLNTALDGSAVAFTYYETA